MIIFTVNSLFRILSDPDLINSLASDPEVIDSILANPDVLDAVKNDPNLTSSLASNPSVIQASSVVGALPTHRDIPVAEFMLIKKVLGDTSPR